MVFFFQGALPIETWVSPAPGSLKRNCQIVVPVSHIKAPLHRSKLGKSLRKWTGLGFSVYFLILV